VRRTAATQRRGRAAALALWGSVHLVCGAADANQLRSRFTTVELKTCSVIKRHADGNTWRCAGLRGYPVTYTEGDLRAFVSFGPDALKRRAAEQTLGAFNSIFDGRRTRATIEWRFRRLAGAEVPYATVMRVFTSRDKARGEVLVVTRVSATEACHMAYVDAKANPDAMALARSAADELAATWSCAAPPKVLGTTGSSPM
jgi:hypothetical protein